MEMRHAQADHCREHELGVGCLSKRVRQSSSEPPESGRLVSREIGHVRHVPIGLDEQVPERSHAVLIGRGVIDPEAIPTTDELAPKRPLAAMLRADRTVVHRRDDARASGYGGDGDGFGVCGGEVGEGVELGGGSPSILAIAFRILVISDVVSQGGYFGGTIRS